MTLLLVLAALTGLAKADQLFCRDWVGSNFVYGCTLVDTDCEDVGFRWDSHGNEDACSIAKCCTGNPWVVEERAFRKSSKPQNYARKSGFGIMGGSDTCTQWLADKGYDCASSNLACIVGGSPQYACTPYRCCSDSGPPTAKYAGRRTRPPTRHRGDYKSMSIKTSCWDWAKVSRPKGCEPTERFCFVNGQDPYRACSTDTCCGGLGKEFFEGPTVEVQAPQIAPMIPERPHVVGGPVKCSELYRGANLGCTIDEEAHCTAGVNPEAYPETGCGLVSCCTSDSLPRSPTVEVQAPEIMPMPPRIPIVGGRVRCSEHYRGANLGCTIDEEAHCTAGVNPAAYPEAGCGPVSCCTSESLPRAKVQGRIRM